jgi:hyperosmotically inducible protein
MNMRLKAWLGTALAAAMIVGCSASDPGITTAVKTKLAADDVVKAYRIDVDTTQGVVTLSGAVDTAAARERAVQLARNTEGVTNVVDNLTVTPGTTPTTGIDDSAQKETGEAAGKAGDAADDAQRRAGEAVSRTGEVVSDAAVTAAVKTKFLADAGVSGLEIDVDTKDRVVTLSGAVATAAEKQRALELARDTEGVKSVVDRLKVKR